MKIFFTLFSLFFINSSAFATVTYLNPQIQVFPDSVGVDKTTILYGTTVCSAYSYQSYLTTTTSDFCSANVPAGKAVTNFKLLIHESEKSCTPTNNNTAALLVYTRFSDNQCEFSCAKDDSFLLTVDNPDAWYYDGETCEWKPICVPVPQPESPYMFLGVFNSQDACIQAQNTIFTHENFTCWTNSCATDLGSEFTLYGIPKTMTCHNLPADVDEDDDCDGIFDYMDPDHPDYGQCQGDSKVVNNRWGKVYNNFEYDYFGRSQDDFCGDKVYNSSGPDGFSIGLTYVDGAYDTRDINPVCIQTYCYIHDYTAPPKTDQCKYSPSDRQPTGYTYRADPDTEDECSALVDGVIIINKKWDTPDLINCPNTAFCFVEPSAVPDPDATTNDTVDSNLTTADNKAIVDAQNITNKHLTDLTDEAKLSNKSLKDILGKSNDILTAIKEGNSNISKVSSTLDTTNSNLDMMNSTLKGIDQSLKGIASSPGTDGSQSILDTASIVDKLNEGLVGDDPFVNVDFTDDGSSTFSDLQLQASDSFSILNENNIFGFANSSSVTLPTFSFNLHGRTVTIFEPSMLNSFPTSEVRSLLLFIFAVLGFVHTFRSV